MWGDSTINTSGVLLASLIEDKGLEILNARDMTYFNGPAETFTAIGISLCSTSALMDYT